MKKYLLLAIIFLLFSCSEDNPPEKEYNYFPMETKESFLFDTDGGEIKIKQYLGIDIIDMGNSFRFLQIGNTNIQIYDDGMYYFVFFNTNLKYLIDVNETPSVFFIEVYNKDGELVKKSSVGKKELTNYLPLTADFGIYIEDGKGIVKVDYKGNLFY